MCSACYLRCSSRFYARSFAFFFIYIDKVSQAVLSCKLEIYADDIVMYQMMISLVQTDFYILYCDWIKETD